MDDLDRLIRALDIVNDTVSALALRVKALENDPGRRPGCKPRSVAEAEAYWKERDPGGLLDFPHWWESNETNGWRLSDGKPIANWKNNMNTWLRTAKKNAPMSLEEWGNK